MAVADFGCKGNAAKVHRNGNVWRIICQLYGSPRPDDEP